MSLFTLNRDIFHHSIILASLRESLALMEDEGGWTAFKLQLEDHYTKLAAYHKELGGVYEDSSSSLMSVLQAALEASLEATKAECDRVREDCESMIRDMAMMRTAMGEFSKSAGTNVDDPFTMQSRLQVKAPLLESQKVLRIAHDHSRKEFEVRAMKVTARYRALEEYKSILPDRIIGISIPHIDAQNPPQDVSLTKLGQLDAANTRCAQEVNRRKHQVQKLGKEIVQLWAELAIETYTLNSDIDRHILLDSQKKPEELGLMDEDTALLEAKKADLVKLKEERLVTMNAALKTIRNLHIKLKLPEHEIGLFLSTVRGVSPQSIALCEKEMDRLNELKKEHIEEFVKDARLTLEELWESLYFNEDARLDFTPAFVDVYTDASLLAHENEILRLQEKLTTLEPLLTLISKHMELDREKKEFAAQTSDPSRFSKRGYNPMAESKMRARIDHGLPKIENAMREAMAKYEEENGQPFLIWGEPYPGTEVEVRQPISKQANTGKEPKKADTKTIRPRTPATSSSSSRPTTATPHKALSRSVSTPVHPSRIGAHKAKASSISSIATPHRGPKTGSTQTLPASRIVVKSKPTNTQNKIPVKPVMKPMQATRIISTGSTTSQVSTENWEAFLPSSEDEDAVSLKKSTETVSVPSNQQVPGELHGVPEEASFVSDWGDEGF